MIEGILKSLPLGEALEVINNYLELRLIKEKDKPEALIQAVNQLKIARASLKQSRAQLKEEKVDGRLDRQTLKQDLKTKKLKKRVQRKLQKLEQKRKQ